MNSYYHKKGLKTICFLGPDGAGKSTLIEEACKSLSHSIPKILIRHLKPVLIAKKRIRARGEVTDPHGKPQRSWIVSNAKILLWFFELWLDRILNKGKEVVTLEIFDRCLYDILIDPRRYRFSGSDAFLKFLIRVAPKNDAVIVVIASANVIHTRKNEVSFEETERQVKAYSELARTQDFACVINDGELIDAVQQVVEYINKYM